VLTLHVLRKNCILNWARINRNPKVTQELAGHADLSTTMTFYSKVGNPAKTHAAREIDALLRDTTDARLTPEP
jgi:integrase